MCFDDNAQPPISLSDGSSARGEDFLLHAHDGNQFNAYLAVPAGAVESQVVILPDVRGLHNFYRELALRFADIGVRALAIDYFGRSAGTGPRDDSFAPMEHMPLLTPTTVAADIDAALSHLRGEHDHRLPTFTVGFCMGGTLSLWAATRTDQLTGVVAFYASLSRSFGGFGSSKEWAADIKKPVLGLFGGDDPGIPVSDVDGLKRTLDSAGVPHEIIVYPGAPHSFFDRRATEFADASADAWNRVHAFLERSTTPISM